MLPDPTTTKFLLDADAIISFRMGEEDFLEKIPNFGKIDEASTYASQSYAKGTATGVLKVGNPSFLWIFACDRNGDRRKEGGDTIDAVLSSAQDFDEIQVEDMKDGRYKVTFVPRSVGEFILSVSVKTADSSEAISGSPFQLEVRPPTDYSRIAADDEAEGKSKMGEAGESGIPSALGTVHHPSGVDFDNTGRYLLVADQSNHRIQIFDSDQIPCKVLGSFGKKGFGLKDLDSPCDVILDRDKGRGV